MVSTDRRFRRADIGWFRLTAKLDVQRSGGFDGQTIRRTDIGWFRLTEKLDVQRSGGLDGQMI